MQMALSLTAWSAWAPDRTGPAAWQAWAKGRDSRIEGAEGIAAESEGKGAGGPNIAAVPAMQRRRLSSLSRMALATAAECSGVRAADACCIFASRHGELSRTVDILNRIVSREDVSPTDFSHSVHSTALGLFSIFMKNIAASNQVVAGEDTFGAALIETTTYLSRFPGRPVLLAYFDEPLPALLKNIDPEPATNFGMALLFDGSTRPNLRVESSYNHTGRSDHANSALDFLKFYLSGATTGSISTSRTTWHWSRL